MSGETIEILEPGLNTTVQDLGRYGYQRYGVPVSGALDAFALRAANILAGNEQGAAGLEMTAIAAKVMFRKESWIALTGADLSWSLDGHPVPRWRALPVGEGSVLSSEGPKDGIRAYLAVAGGIDVPVVMGSRSTYVKARLGGLEGRSLRASDVLSTVPLEAGARFVERALPDEYEIVTYGGRHEVRVILGPQHEAFPEHAIDTLLSSTYGVSPQSDRMGYRLEGPAIAHKDGPDIVSDGMPLGALQVPGDGMPIVLLADRGTTGGYAKIATVISADMDRIAQAGPGDSIAFRAVTLEEAHAAVREQEAVLRDLDPAAHALSGARLLRISAGGEAFEVVGQSGEPVSQPEWTGAPGSMSSRKATATVDGHTYEFEMEVQQRD